MGQIRAAITGMDCGSCALTIEDGVRQLTGVQRVAVSFTTESIVVEGDTTFAEVERRVAQLGYHLWAPDASQAPAATSVARRGLVGFMQFLWAQPRLRASAAAGVILLISLPFGLAWAPAAVALVVGAPVALKGMRALRFSRRITIDLLMTIATVGALLIGAPGEAATVMLLYTLGEALELYSAESARQSLRSLLALQPPRATVLRSSVDAEHDHQHDHSHDHDHGHDHDHERGAACHGHGDAAANRAKHATTQPHWHAVQIAASEVRVGDRLLVRPGERVPTDGRILAGESTLNESAVTGESMPIRRTVGDAALAGSLNGAGALEIEATRPASDSTIARIAALVTQAQAQRSPTERFIDRFARIYTPLVILLAAAVVLVPWLVFGQPLLDSSSSERGWLYRGLALLIVACPCALVISIPVTVVSALARLAGLGVLVKGGAHLDALADLRVLAFDKTGTLTSGKPAVTATQTDACLHPPVANDDCAECDDVLALAVAVEQRSEHPLAQAVIAAAGERGVRDRYGSAEGVRAVAGRGVVGRLGASQIAVGSDALFSAQDEHALEVPGNFAAAIRSSNRTVMLVARDRRLIGAIGVEDQLREGSRQALAELRLLDPPVRAVMLTGDNARIADDIAQRAGNIDEVQANLQPEQKLRAVEALKKSGGVVGMVGDGINDTPALARADVGIAMGGAGSPQAMESADVILMQDDLGRVPCAIKIARRTRALVKQNIALSLGLKLAFVALMVPGWATLWLAVVADVGATLIVTLNGMRLLRA